MESNRKKAEKCIKTAQKALDVPNRKSIDNVKKLLEKADNLYPTQEAKGLISSLLYQYEANHLTDLLQLLILLRSKKEQLRY